MIFAKDHKTRDMFDPLARFGPHRKNRLERSWAKLFREEVLPELPAHMLRPYYSGSTGAPTKDLSTMLGIALLQQMHDLTDEDTVDQVAFNMKWQYALNLSDQIEREVYVCPKTLWTLRDLLAEHDLSGTIFTTVTDKLARLFAIDPSRQRLDSLHLFSNMRHLGRIGLFVRVVKTFLVNLKRHRRDLFDALPTEMTEKYLRKSGESVFSMVKPTESGKTLSMLGDDLFFLAQRFRAEEAVSGMSSFQQLCRCLAEQCVVEEDGASGEKKVRVKPNKEVASDSLQNPSDPDATYCGHKGQGYQAQIMETYSPAPSEDPEGSKEEGEPVLRLITHVAVEPAHVSDAHAVIPAIDDTKKRGLAPAEVLADSLYGSEKNVEDAATMGTEVVAPVPGGGKESRSAFLSDFTFSPEGGIMQCPAGHAPIEDTVHRKHREVIFATGDCFGCPRKASCPIRSVRLGYGFSYDRKQVKMAQRRAREKTASFKERYRYRSGVESTMSELDRLTGVKQLRVRGMKAVRFAVTLKVLGVNLFRSAAVYCKGSGGKPTGKTPCGPNQAGIAPLYGEWCRLMRRLVDHVAPNFGTSFIPAVKAA